MSERPGRQDARPADRDARLLVSVDLRFTTSEDPEQLAERVREAVRMVVGSKALEEFRWRSLPLEPPARRLR